MNLKTIISVLLCLSLICISSGLEGSSYKNVNSPENAKYNVITESDAGGGDVSRKDVILIIVVAVITFMLLTILYCAYYC